MQQSGDKAGFTEQEIVVSFTLVAPRPTRQIETTLDGIHCGDIFRSVADCQTGEGEGENSEQES